ncbi:hypothetical protein M3215_18100 [Bacillus cytotoxicus]|uniref:Uncharacterized protein n=1 Tax=Bacillus cytotoxicus TaxID=580165 RepID=A0ACC6AA98_9BACI|nr:hypothetical protein [Bacillus cytotoxicus]
MKRIGLALAGLALSGIMTFAVNNTLESSTLNKGDTWSPQRPDLAYSEGDGGGIETQATHAEHFTSKPDNA